VGEFVERAAEIANDLGGNARMVKAQIDAGGKAGGVERAASMEDVKAHASSMLGKVLITHQTGAAGKVVRKVLIEQCTEIDQEFYVGIALDRATSGISLMAWSTIWEQEAVACDDLAGHTEIYWC
jgi:succinyl-CoA synthetase beta subunit